MMNMLEEAIIYATVLHQGKVRKFGGIPYILHPMEVAQILSTMTDDAETMGDYTELYLPAEPIKPLTEEMLHKRDALLAAGQYDDPMLRYARQFASADQIVIAAPFWDGSFPSLLKVYIENIYAIGVITAYDSAGLPVGLCKASELVYVTTAKEEAV